MSIKTITLAAAFAAALAMPVFAQDAGGHAGHNGLRDIIAKCSAEFRRIRFGIGRPPGQMEVASFVLQDFSSVERKELPVLLELAADQVEEILA